MRSVAQPFVSELRQIQRDITRARKLLQPIMEERLRDMECPGYERPDDLCQWLLDALPEDEKRDYQSQVELQLVLSAASIHTTSNLVADCIFDRAAHPDMQEELRQAVKDVLDSGAAWNRKDSMTRLKKMDSFIKEVQRLAGNVSKCIPLFRSWRQTRPLPPGWISTHTAASRLHTQGDQAHRPL